MSDHQVKEEMTDEEKDLEIEAEVIENPDADNDMQEELSPEELKAKLNQAEKEAAENYEKYLRVQADFDNFRRRTRKEKEDQAKYAALPLIEQLLPTLDNFERALDASKETQNAESLAQGVEMVLKQVDQVLTGEGLEVIPSVGETFDPNVHQAVMQVESDEYEPGIVVEELQKGYKLKEKVVRPAMVKVSS